MQVQYIRSIDYGTLYALPLCPEFILDTGEGGYHTLYSAPYSTIQTLDSFYIHAPRVHVRGGVAPRLQSIHPRHCFEVLAGEARKESGEMCFGTGH
jgi:hypothetical protein